MALSRSPEQNAENAPSAGRLCWDIFCRVIDNFGDAGVCWRLAKQLVSEQPVVVRLWIDDLTPLAMLCPAIDPARSVQIVEGIEVRLWSADFPNTVSENAVSKPSWESSAADAVIEAFACEVPLLYQKRMGTQDPTPVWINLEYLSAESWVEDCHLVPSTVTGPARGVPKFFFFPGFTEKTGGLLRERGLPTTRERFLTTTVEQFWRELGLDPRRPDELRVSLFCYENPSLATLLDHWVEQDRPITLLVSPGRPVEQVSRWLSRLLSPGMKVVRGSLTVHGMPFLPQDQYDEVLWACDINFVRGEDSFVRAQWAEKPFVWQIYPQDEQAHETKLAAFLDRYLEDCPAAKVVRDFWNCWNGIAPPHTIGDAWNLFVENRAGLEIRATSWAERLDRRGNLADILAKFVRTHQNGRESSFDG